MDNPWAIALVTVVAVVVVVFVGLLLLGGGSFSRVGLALRACLRVLTNAPFAEKITPLLAPPEAKPARPPKPSGVPLRLLAVLQRDGRLVDFLMEDIQAYPDQQIGEAVREIHRDCQAVLKKHLTLGPVLPQSEGGDAEVPAGFDPSAVRLTGNVTGQPPFRGTLKHAGWRVREIRLNPPPEGQDEFVLMPAEIELP